MIINSKRMAACQSGFHDQKLQKRLVRVPIESGPNVVLCDFCLSRMMEAQQQGGDLTLAILYQWAKEYDDIPKLPEFLRRDCLKRCQIVQFVNHQLLRLRKANLHFPRILLDPDEKERFIGIVEENKNAIHDALGGFFSNSERGNIALRLWTGCLCAAKECRRTCVTEHEPDGTAMRESPYSSDIRAESFNKIMITSREDPIYQAGVEIAPVWELIENAGPDKKMYLDGIPELNQSPITKYLKDRNKTVISAEDIEMNSVHS
jgi:hypothetical protein